VKTAALLALVATAAIVSGCGGKDAPPAAGAPAGDASISAPAMAQPSSGPVTKAGASKIDGADFILEDQPPLEQKVDLAKLPTDEQKAIYFELRRLLDEASERVMLSDVDVDKLSGEEAYRLMDNVQNKAKYEFAAARGMTVDQLEQLDVTAMRSGWEKNYLRQ